MLLLPPARSLGALQRVLLVALLTPVVLIVAIASVPAFVVLPFFPGGTDRVTLLLTTLTGYVTALLTNSRPDP
ncbi:dTMP kinase [Streptomyces sp. NPDC001492]